MVFVSSFILIFIFFLSPFVQARSGCCSHHSGVCGCSCCDGTPLSSTCAPYYPNCSGGGSFQQQNVLPTNTPIPWPTWTPKPLPTSTSIPTEIPSTTLIPTSSTLGIEANTPTPIIAAQTTSSSSGGILGLLLLGAGSYWVYKRRKPQQPPTQETPA